MDIELSVRAKAHARRAGAPWLETANLELATGPHLFLDWRFVMPGELGLIGPYWAAEDGQPMPLRLWGMEEWKDRPVDARYVPQDVPQGVRIVAQPAEKGEPFPADGPPGGRIVHDGGTYRTWYRSSEDGEAGALRYAESEDGYEWKKASECTFDWSACPEAAGQERPDIFIDPVAPDDERFKMFFRAGVGRNAEDRGRILAEFQRTRPDDIYPTSGTSLEHLGGMYGAVSADGIRWKTLPGPLVIHYSDTANVVHYDERLGRYVWYARCNWFYGRRCIGRAETDDFRCWPGPELLVWPATDLHPTDDWYTNSKTRYPGAGDHHLMFPALYHHADDSSELRLFSSPDGIVWSEVPGGSVLSTGEFDAWDGGCVFGGLDLVPLPGDRVGLPYRGYLYPHKYPRNRHTLKPQTAYALWDRGRLGALEAVESGSFTTLPLIFAGNKLILNAQIRRAGEVRVEVADREGSPLPGRSFAEADPLVGDFLDRTVTWKGESGIDKDADQPLLLRFRLRAAKLFAFEFAS